MTTARRKSEPVVFKFLVDKQPFSVSLMVDEVGFGLTPRETGRLKRLTNGTAGIEMWRSLEQLDAEVLAALCVIAVERTGQPIDADKLFDGQVEWELDMDGADEDDEDGPPLEADGEDSVGEIPSITKTPAITGHQPSRITSTSRLGA